VPKTLQWGLAGNPWRANPVIDNITNNLRDLELYGYMLGPDERKLESGGY